MKISKTLVTVFLILIFSILASNFLAMEKMNQSNNYIIAISFCKFLLIAFYFMDVREAHIFWKITISLLAIFISSYMWLI